MDGAEYLGSATDPGLDLPFEFAFDTRDGFPRANDCGPEIFSVAEYGLVHEIWGGPLMLRLDHDTNAPTPVFAHIAMSPASALQDLLPASQNLANPPEVFQQSGEPIAGDLGDRPLYSAAAVDADMLDHIDLIGSQSFSHLLWWKQMILSPSNYSRFKTADWISTARRHEFEVSMELDLELSFDRSSEARQLTWDLT